jgi:hypothetical protein
MAASGVRDALLGLVLVVLAAPALGEVFKWTDKTGAVHYTSDINQVPTGQRDLARAAANSGKGSLQRIPSSAPSLRTTRSAPTRGASRPASPASPAPAAEERVEGKSEAQWREQTQRHRARIAMLEPIAERCEEDRFDWSAGDGGRKYRAEQAEAEACDGTRRDLALERSQLENLEERAHGAGVPPGWMREP